MSRDRRKSSAAYPTWELALGAGLADRTESDGSEVAIASKAALATRCGSSVSAVLACRLSAAPSAAAPLGRASPTPSAGGRGVERGGICLPRWRAGSPPSLAASSASVRLIVGMAALEAYAEDFTLTTGRFSGNKTRNASKDGKFRGRRGIASLARNSPPIGPPRHFLRKRP